MLETMKRAKHLLAFALAALVALCVVAPSPALAEGETYNGTITINTVNGQEYTLYKLFDATVVDGRAANADNGISYTLMEGKSLSDNTWFELSNGNVVLKSGANIESDADAFRTWAESYGIANATKLTGNGSAQSWTGLEAGYYYITTTTGSLVTVTSITPDVTVNDKNTAPSIDKNITSVSTSGTITSDGESALVQVGSTVGYTVSISAYKGAEGYVLTDTLSDGLDFVVNSVAVNVGETALTTPSDYAAAIDGRTLTVTFTKSYLDSISVDTTIDVTYSATVNANAVVGATGNKNTASLSYGHTTDASTTKPSTPVDEPKVYLASITVNKTDGTNPLAGAKFKLKNSAGLYYAGAGSFTADGVEIDAAAVTSGDDVTSYTAVFTGLQDGTYTLEESTVPAGYNKAADQTITITGSDFSNDNLVKSATVVNQSGTVLPSTGGMGTTILYIVGGVLVVVALAVLITKRRMSATSVD